MGTLGTLFAPERVAVIGASEDAGSVGRALIENLQATFEGEVVAVNPNADTVLGIDAVDSITDLEGPVDLAVVAVPPPVVIDVLEGIGEAGIENVVVITAGFGETGSEGAKRERQLHDVADRYDLNLVGPNSLGVISTGVGLNATFAPENAPPGSISFMSQSGAFVTAVLDWARTRSIGFKDVVSLGNKAVLDERNFIEEWGEDPDTDVILGYLEDVVDGREFIDTAREVAQETPIVLVKSGRTEAGASAAASHTGAIAGSERAYEAGLEQAGIVRAKTVQELFDYGRVLSAQPVPETDSVAIVTNAGGPGVMATDAVGDSALDLAALTGATRDGLAEALPEAANIYNPIDVLGDAPVERFADALDVVVDDPTVGAVVVIACPTATLSFEALAEELVALEDDHELPVATALMGGESAQAAGQALSEVGIPTFFDPARAVDSLDALARYGAIRDREHVAPTTFEDVDPAQARDVLTAAAARDTNRLGVEAMGILDAYGIPTPDGCIVTTPDDAHESARELLDGPDEGVVMKIVSPDILHKSDIGGVRVGVSLDEVRDAYENLISRARNYQPDAKILGVQVQEMVDLDRGTETIAGLNRDPQFGPVVLFGLGGIFVEVLEDTTVKIAPVSEPDAQSMIDEIDAAPLLRGARGREPVDETAVVETIQRLSQLATDFPAIMELDVNPLVATPEGVSAIDVRLTIDQEKL